MQWVKEQEHTLAYLEWGFSVLPAHQKDLGSYLKYQCPGHILQGPDVQAEIVLM